MLFEMKWKSLRHPDTTSKDSTANGNSYFKGFHQPTNHTTSTITNIYAYILHIQTLILAK